MKYLLNTFQLSNFLLSTAPIGVIPYSYDGKDWSYQVESYNVKSQDNDFINPEISLLISITCSNNLQYKVSSI